MRRLLNILVWPVMAVPVVYLALIWNKLPEQVAMHFDWSGQPDRFGSKKELLTMCLVLSGFSPVLYLILSNIYRIDPKKYAAENKNRLRSLAFGVVVFMSALLCMILYSSSKGNISFNTGIVLAGTGLLFQASMLFIGLIMILLLQPLLTGAAFILTDIVVTFIMGLVCFIPFVLFVRGVVRS